MSFGHFFIPSPAFLLFFFVRGPRLRILTVSVILVTAVSCRLLFALTVYALPMRKFKFCV